MKYMLDTSLCIHMIRNKPVAVMERFRRHQAEEVCISSITYAELCYGIGQGRYRERNLLALSVFLSGIQIVSFDSLAAIHLGKLQAEPGAGGRTANSMDMLIAAHALSLGLTIVTNDPMAFERAKGLRVENWVS